MEIRPVSIHVAHTMWYDAHVSQATELQESALRVGSDKLGKRSIQQKEENGIFFFLMIKKVDNVSPPPTFT